MAEALNKADRIVSGVLIVVRTLRYKACRLILFQFSDMRSPPKKGIKKQPYGCNEEKSLTALILGIAVFTLGKYG